MLLTVTVFEVYMFTSTQNMLEVGLQTINKNKDVLVYTNKANKGYFICKSEMVEQNGRDGLRWSDVKFLFCFCFRPS